MTQAMFKDKVLFEPGDRVIYTHESINLSQVPSGKLRKGCEGTVVKVYSHGDGRMRYDISWDGLEVPLQEGYFVTVLERA